MKFLFAICRIWNNFVNFVERIPIFTNTRNNLIINGIDEPIFKRTGLRQILRTFWRQMIQTRPIEHCWESSRSFHNASGPGFMKQRVQSATVCTVTKGKSVCKLGLDPRLGNTLHTWFNIKRGRGLADRLRRGHLPPINKFRFISFVSPGNDFPGQLSMKKRVSSGLLGRLLEDSWFRGIDNEEAMNSVTGQQTADPTNAAIASTRPSLFVVRYPGTWFLSLSLSSIYLSFFLSVFLSVVRSSWHLPLLSCSRRREGSCTREPRHRFVIHVHDVSQGDRELLNTFPAADRGQSSGIARPEDARLPPRIRQGFVRLHRSSFFFLFARFLHFFVHVCCMRFFGNSLGFWDRGKL